jgi:Uma2 family endonuclease
MALSQKILPHYTYDDYVHWEGRWELIDGFPIAMSPSPAPKHQRIAAALSSIFIIALKNCKKCQVYSPLDYKVAEDIVLQPDILVVCKDIVKNFLDFRPALVVEILSPSTALRDRHTKFDIYQQQGIPYYLIADPENNTIEVYQLKNAVYTLLISSDDTYEFTLEQGCHASIYCKDIWQ